MSAAVTGRRVGILTALLALAGTLAVAALSLALGGFDPLEAFGALLHGAFGRPETFLSITLVRAVPLLLTGLAVAIAFRAGIWNIGAEGQLYAGAVAAIWVGLTFPGLPAVLLVPAVLLASMIGGLLWIAVPAAMKLRLGVGEVITTILMNFVAIELTGWLVQGPMQESRGVFNQTDRLAESATLPMLIPGTRLHLGFGLAVLIAVGMWVVLRWTRAGFAIRTVGASPGAARSAARLSTGRITLAVFLVSGALAGLAGGVQVSGVTHSVLQDLSPGYGYTAIAVALLAGLHPVAVIGTAILFGALEGGAAAMGRSVGVPYDWVRGIEALVILAVLLADRGIREVARD